MATFALDEFVANPSVEQLELCKKQDLFEIAANYGVPVSTACVKQELKAVVLNSLADQAVLVVPGSDSPGLVVASEDHPRSPDPPASGRSAPQVGEAAGSRPVDPISHVGPVGPEITLFTLPLFESLSVESSPASKVDAWLKLWIAHLQLDQ